MAWGPLARSRAAQVRRIACTPEEQILQNQALRRVIGNLCNKCGIGQRHLNMTICKECNIQRRIENRSRWHKDWYFRKRVRDLQEKIDLVGGKCVQCGEKLKKAVHQKKNGKIKPNLVCTKCFGDLFVKSRWEGESVKYYLAQIMFEYKKKKGVLLPATQWNEAVKK